MPNLRARCVGGSSALAGRASFEMLQVLLCSTHGLVLSGHRAAYARHVRRQAPVLLQDEAPADRALDEAFAKELGQRGLLTSLQALEKDGPSAFKDPRTVVEYVMLCLQHRGDEGIAEAFRFTMPPSGSSSATHGTRQSSRRISWIAGRIIEGTACGRSVDADEFAAEVREKPRHAVSPTLTLTLRPNRNPSPNPNPNPHQVRENFGMLCGCATWRFASTAEDPRIPGNEHKKPTGGRTGGAIQVRRLAMVGVNSFGS